MPLLPIDLPLGMYKNGTPYSRRGRWTDGNLVRWHDGAVRPIGGWLRREKSSGGGDVDAVFSTPADEAIRDIFAWRTIVGQSANVVMGSNAAVYHLSTIGVITDITPAGFTPNNSEKDSVTSTGFGSGLFGSGAFGVENPVTSGDAQPPDRWYFDAFGDILLTGVRSNTDLYELDLSTLTLSAVSNAPSSNQDVCVTEQRQVFVIGGNDEPRRVQASEIEDRTVWTAARDNQVIDRTLPGTGKLLRCVPVLGQVLILSETDAHAARYIGPPYVYAINVVGENCGPIAPETVVKTDRFAVWWGYRNFWLFDGSVQSLPCDVIDFLYDDIDPAQISKITAFSVTDYGEIWWLYQSSSTTTTEVDSYVIWDYKTRTWNTGRIDRTAGFDRGVLPNVHMITSDGKIFLHELDGVFPTDEGEVFVETGALDIANGEKNVAIKYIYPDSQEQNDLEFTIIARQFPNETEYTYGPYPYGNPASTRALGRSCKVRSKFLTATSELGLLRLDLAPIGTGKR